jgi:hypothetical protein
MMTRVRDAMSDILDGMTLADMVGNGHPRRHRTTRARSKKGSARTTH